MTNLAIENRKTDAIITMLVRAPNVSDGVII
jgi:hypothetical protein